MFVGLTALTLALLPLVVRAQDENVTIVMQALEAAHIIPTIIPDDAKLLRAPIEVVFPGQEGTLTVNAGANLTIQDVQNAPLFSLQSTVAAILHKPYLQVIMDLDAPNPQSNSESPLLLLLLADQAANVNVNGEFVLLNQSKSPDLAPYLAPNPSVDSDPHRVVVLSYLQGTFGVTPPPGFDPNNRTNFNITEFTSSVQGNNFTLVAATFFNVGANLNSSVVPNATLPDGSLRKPTASSNGSSSGSGSGSGPSGNTNTSDAFGDNATLMRAIAWSVVGVLTATGALLV